MKLLIITQKADINDDNLGFFHSWLEKLAKRLDKLYVVCLWQGEYSLPQNTIVYSMGKEKGYSKLRQLLRLEKFLLKNLRKVDGLFIHMCPIYSVAAYPLVKAFRKKMLLWYVHKSVNLTLKTAEKCVDKILTASPEGCRLKNRKKIKIVGHGTDTEFFRPLSLNFERQASNKFKILFVGRIAPVKDLETLIRAVDILINRKNIQDVKVEIIGSTIEYYEREYHLKLIRLIKEKELVEHIKFLGGIPHREVLKFYQNSNVLLNLSPTGGMDKAVLEAMACGTPVLACNEAFLSILDNKYLFKKKDPQDLAKKIIDMRNMPRDGNLREIIVKNHNLDNLIDKIINTFKEL